ncbi:MAG: flagellar assembly protein FliW [Coprococcus sp.]|nr:flagellar assembly protein FliW [Coprococcus sp.]
MKINAKYFGQVSYEQKDTIHVINGLFGFETYTEYLPLPFNEYNDSLISLQSLENDTLSFILMNPFGVYPDYKPTLSDQDLEELGAESEDDISYYVTSVILDSIAESTIDLKAPLAVNGFTRKAKQIILDNPEYTFRHTLSSLIHKGEEE